MYKVEMLVRMHGVGLHLTETEKLNKKQRIQGGYNPILKKCLSAKLDLEQLFVQLCVARNKRRLSSKRYQGAAQVTSRRARKGFQLKYTPDTHWSAALYRGLSHVQMAQT